MQITSLEKMEQIVSKSKTLGWDGWTVVNSFPSEKGYTSKQGTFNRKTGRWHIENRYEPTVAGWNIPDKLVG